MKLHKYLYVAVCMLLASTLNLQAQTSVTVTTAGTLKDLLPADYLTSVTDLTISGPLNGLDILTIKSMREKLSVLNLQNAQIVEDKVNAYHVTGTTSYYTQNNVIGDFMFYAMTNLTKIVMPKDVYSIGSWYYWYADRDPWSTDENGNTILNGRPQTESASNDKSSYGCAAFARCVSLKEITFPTALVYIGPKAFGDCTSLTTVSIPEGVEFMGNYTFQGCIELNSAALPSTLNTRNKIQNEDLAYSGYNSYTFADCTKLNNVTLGAGITKLSYFMFQNCTALTSITLPENLTDLASAFEGCSALTTLSIPATVTSLGRRCFNGCSSLKSISLPEGITEILSYTFQNCTALTSFTVPNSVTSIEYNAFGGCSALNQINLSTELNTIGNNAFYGCTALTEITLPEKLMAINSYTFANTGLKEIELPSLVMTIAEGAFKDCKDLVSINLPANMSDISREVFSGCEKLSDITFPSGLLTIQYHAFYGCKSLKSVTISGSIQTIEQGAFQDSGLEEVILKEGITTLGENAFAGCEYLRSVTFPKSMKTLGGFGGTSIREILLADGAAPEAIAAYAFQNCDSLTTITLPASIKSIGEYAFEDCDFLKTVDLTKTTISSISNNTFWDCRNLESIQLPNTVTAIKYGAFWSCVRLTNINLDGLLLTEIGGIAFEYCENLNISKLDFSNSTFTTIENRTFANAAKNLKEIIFPNTLTSIGEAAFSNVPLEKVIWSSNLTKIGHNAFEGHCIKELTFPESLNEIGDFTFREGKSETVIIPSFIQYIGTWAFLNTSINKLIINPNAGLDIKDSGVWSSLNDVYWNSTKQFPKDKFKSIRNLFLPEGGSVSSTDGINAIFYNGLTDKYTVGTNGSNPEYGAYYSTYSQSQDIKAKHVTYTKHFNTESGYAEAGGWKTLVLPFDVTETYYVKDNYYNGKTTYDTIYIAPFGSNVEGALPYWLYELGTDGNYKAATAIKAHTPYLICMPNNNKYPSEYNISGNVTFAANNEAGVLLSKTEGALKRSVGTKFDFVPTYESLFKNDSIYALNEDNYYYADDKTYKNGSVFIKNYNDGGDWEPAVDPFQAYLVSKETNVTTASTRGPLYYSIGGGNGEITGIEDTILMPDQAVKVYARGGVLYIESNAARTIHIYNVSGRTVRTIEAQEGLNEVRGLGNGIYLLEGQKVIVK